VLLLIAFSAQNYEISSEIQNISPKILVVPKKVVPLQPLNKMMAG